MCDRFPHKFGNLMFNLRMSPLTGNICCEHQISSGKLYTIVPSTEELYCLIRNFFVWFSDYILNLAITQRMGYPKIQGYLWIQLVFHFSITSGK